MPIDVVISATRQKITIRVRGDVDAASVDDLSAILGAADDAPLLVVDLSASAFVDISGVRSIVECATRRSHSGKELAVAAPPPSAVRILLMLPGRRHVRWEPRGPTVGPRCDRQPHRVMRHGTIPPHWRA